MSDDLQNQVKVEHEQTSHLCHICAIVFDSSDDLLQHLKVHAEMTEPKVFCQLCGGSYKNAGLLRRHMVIHKDSEKRFQCPKCPKISPTRNALACHIKAVHNYTVHKCHMCGKEFKRGAALTVRISHPFVFVEQLKPINCIALNIFLIAGTLGHPHRRKFILLPLLSKRVQIAFEYV